MLKSVVAPTILPLHPIKGIDVKLSNSLFYLK